VTDGPFADRLDQLRARWRAEPSSRGFLQIAEEYRREGRVSDALAMLDEGLRQQPGYLSALVAKGRCHLELGQPEAARDTLERVVRQDPMQAVANKLLVRAYLEAGEPRRARERLDLYGLLQGGDPEVQELSARIAALEGGRPAAGEDVFDLPPLAVPPPELRLPGEEPAAPVWQALPAAGGPAAEPLADEAPAASPIALAASSNGDSDGEPFAGLGTPAARRRYLAALAAEGIFVFDELPAPPSTESAAPFWEVPAAAADDEDTLDVSPVPAAAEEGPAATVTLGHLYLEQGHAGEAERIFREVLRREPENAGARAGLEEIRGRAALSGAGLEAVDRGRVAPPDGALGAAELLAGFRPDPKRGDTPAARKAYVLSRYLERLRGRGGQSRVP
jgi:tetratricopeptide (TPR) repeat protein